ncbi:ribonuclease catalytic domain-containing protein [Deinococcus peraridilitoris]|uniref:Exoribonuclease R n=1 Tax=Deinococcus peraridilitoris (strain DSM 19664 / LMG 22246 / CIP 109416 / KR-200) TaxID=937777 RepID=L0A130_DEIPD|nr:RNB domain-containing ribonuclease [Deinococcus peraridilitoris]AFZ67149.1 exoribonuclease R [Deinococcus peraridilitoris DSM 19664]
MTELTTVAHNASLVLYKQKPARVSSTTGDKLDIETSGGTVRVRPKDVLVLHPGPLTSLSALRTLVGEPAEVWELMEGAALPLSDVAELAFGDFTPDSALAVWGWVQEGTYFGGTPSNIVPRSAAQVQATLTQKEARADESRAWEVFLDGLRRGEVSDPRRLADVEALALGRAQKSRTLNALGRPETPENAHALLLSLKVWDETRHPYPARFGAALSAPHLPVPSLPGEERLDLSHLSALAIDDEGSSDPDDALSLERLVLENGEAGWRLWVHVADAAALVAPDGEIDREARKRGATLYLPETTVPMLPEPITGQLGLGLADTSPALSIAVQLSAAFEPQGAEVHLTRIRVTRLTYAEAQRALDAGQPGPLQELAALAVTARTRREAAGAVMLELPEVRVRVRDGEVIITPLPPLQSRAVVQEAMMLAGESVATWAQQRDLPLPFAAQDPPLARVEGEQLAQQWARRKSLSRTRFSPRAGRHAGLGLQAYAQATSPLRRYLDLVVHQQLRAALRGERPLTGAEIAARIAEADLAAGAVRAAERAANRHWTLVYLSRRPGWSGEGVVVERRGAVTTVLLGDLALDVPLTTSTALGEELRLELGEIDLPSLTSRWRVVTDS